MIDNDNELLAEHTQLIQRFRDPEAHCLDLVDSFLPVFI